MLINTNEILFALSAALDCVERELVGIKTGHSKRVAYLSTRMGLEMGQSADDLFYMASAAVLHDNALTEFIQEELQNGEIPELSEGKQAMALHCVMGERNVESLPFYGNIREAILYHHERADAKGPFGKRCSEIPIFARLIHFSDTLDAVFGLNEIDRKKQENINNYVKENNKILFDDDCVNSFLTVFEDCVTHLHNKKQIDDELWSLLPARQRDYSGDELAAFSSLFARIVDYKSHFTCSHSLGIAQKLYTMAEYYGWDDTTKQKLYFAGALHDIGKLTISNSIIEKPEKLTENEYDNMKKHASETFEILSAISGLEDVADWAGAHHEKLDGSGYPLGKKADELSEKQRLLTCVDIYQALREPRPYKDGMTHASAMEILYKMAKKGEIDMRITRDIDLCFAGT